MGLRLYAESAIQMIADAIRSKYGTSSSYKVSEMASAIEAFPNSIKLTDAIISKNGTYTPPSGYTFGRAIVSVPVPTMTQLVVDENGTYSADSGTAFSVVNIMAQSTSVSELFISQNGYYEATSSIAFNPVVVSIPNPSMTSSMFLANGIYYSPTGVFWSAVSASIQTTPEDTLISRTASSYILDASIVGSCAFATCSQLRSISLPNCTFIGHSAFYSCSQLSTVFIPECEDLGSYAFAECRQLSSASFPAVRNIYEYTFYSCQQLRSISFQECRTVGQCAFVGTRVSVVDLPKCISIDSFAFYSSGLDSYYRLVNAVSIPECIYIGSSAFMAHAISNLYAPKVSYIGSFAFSWCSLLSSPLDLQECITVEDGAFYTCSRIPYVNLPKCISIIGSPSTGAMYGAFYGCSDITSVSLPVCKHIGRYTFARCTSLSFASLPECEYIGDSAFRSCTSLSSAYLPKCKSLMNYAFSDTAITRLELPACSVVGYLGSMSYLEYFSAMDIKTAGTVYVGLGLFRGCDMLSEIHLTKCTSLPSNAFKSAFRLTKLFLHGSQVCSLVGQDWFLSTPIAGYTSYTSGVYGSIYVPSNLVSIYKSSANWSNFSSRIFAIP